MKPIKSFHIICNYEFKLFGVGNCLNATGHIFVKHLLLLFLISNCSIINAQSNENNFKKINIEIDGEEVFDVNAITQDHQGYMWMATNLGLIRYNGLEGKKYYNKVIDSTSFEFYDIKTLFTDYQGNIWIGATYGLSKYNPDCDCIQQYPSINEDISSTKIRSFTEDKNKNVWIGTIGGGLFRYERESDSFTRFLHKPSDSINVINDNIIHLLADHNNNLWIGTNSYNSKRGSGLIRFNISTGNVKRFLHEPTNPNSLVDNRITALYEDQQGQILIGTYKCGLHIYDSKSESLIRVNYDENKPNQLHAPYTEDNVYGRDPFVRLIHQDQNGGYWISTTGGGINYFNATSKTTRNYSLNLINPQLLWSFFEDKQGNLWIGSIWGGGLFKADPYERKYNLNPNFRNASYVYESPLSPGFLWVINRQEGLGKMNLATNKTTKYVHSKDNSKSIGHNWVRSAYQESKNILWVGLGLGGVEGVGQGNGGVDRMDIETETFTHFKLTRNDDALDNFSYTVYSIVEDHERFLWLGAGIGGLFRSDEDKKGFKHFSILKPGDTLRKVIINRVFFDSNGDLWASDFNNQGTLYLFNRQEGQFNPFLKGFKATNFLIDEHGWYLISTWDKGLLHLNPMDGNFIQYTKKDGLPNNKMVNIAKANEGFYWIGTSMGPAKFDAETGKFSTVDLPKGRYNLGILKTNNGQIFLASNYGLISFYPDHVIGNPFPPDVILESIQVTGNSFNLLSTKSNKSELLLSHKQNDLTFEYAGLHYSDPTKNQYRYMLEPYDSSWIDAISQRTARYTNLNPGEYTFQVIASNSDGVWNEQGASLKIIIAPPWWQTWWAYTIYILSIIFSIYVIRRYELSRIQLKNQLKLESVTSKKLRELDQVKSRFFANISHEFRTPLTLILGQISSLISDTLDSKIKSKLEVANRNARRLLHLINQLLDLSKIESGSMKLKSVRADIVSFTKNIFYSFESLAKEKNISLNCKCEYNSIEIDFEPDKLEKVFLNLLSNAFKFTSEGGEIEIAINCTPLSIVDNKLNKDRFVEITISDSGIGIPAENIPHLFDRFYQVDNSTTREHQGTGIGLALSKELIELHGGKIRVESKSGEGSTFIVQLPFEKCELTHSESPIVEAELSEPTKNNVVETNDLLIKTEKDMPSTKTSDNEKTGKEIILVVEDNSDVRNYIAEQLINDFQVIEANDGQEGIIQAKKRIPDLIITDVMMPKVDGYQLTTDLKQDEKTSHIPIIMLTAKAALDNKIEGLEIGADDYLIKPFNSEELLVRVKNLIATRRQLRRQFSKATIIKPSDVTTVSMDQQFLQKVLNAVDKHIEDEQFGVDKLAEKANMSVSQLNRKLGALIDQPAGRLIRSMRLQRAADLLKKESGTIAEICYQVGFNDQTSFTRAFKKQFGESPSKYKIKLTK
ncbi:diguanylate cyclase/phosphodiesterase (GGDEF & EAL domains) with PAS/PAC sensor(s) [hydrothermal vent metagenome]|uniref:histidine kinase n=1 Tax=hydrothermal vent metagenome TaxID=652676 RepID=A0A3B1CBT7_9ZZZZ